MQTWISFKFVILQPNLLLASKAEFSALNNGNGVGAFDTFLLHNYQSFHMVNLTFFIGSLGFEIFFIAVFNLTLCLVLRQGSKH